MNPSFNSTRHVKNIFKWSMIILLGLVFTGKLLCQNQGPEPVRKTVFIIVDGIPEDVLREVETPHLDNITDQGALLPAYVGGEPGTYTETPTISAVGYNTLLTGTWVNKHNVWDNDIADPNYQYWSIFRLFKEQYPHRKIAIFSTWLDNRTKLIGTGLDATEQLEMDYHFDGFEHDTLKFPHDEAATYIRDIDNLVADEAARNICTHAPDLSWVYLQYTDNTGHQFGDHPVFYESIRLMDDQVGRIWHAVQEREKNHNEKWLVIITTDHGRDADTGKDHGGQSERERSTWIVTNQGDINQYGQNNRLGIVDILPTIADFMDISIPKYRAVELDGVPFIGVVDAINLKAEKSGNAINLSWESITKLGKARLWIATTNKFRQGGEDHYYKLFELDLAKEEARIAIGMPETDLYKIVLETPHHYLNTWLVEE